MAVNNKIKTAYYEIISALIITFSVVPGFNNIGKLFLQTFLTAFIVIAFLSVADRTKIKPDTVGRSLIIMTVFWVCFALYKQVLSHIHAGDKSLNWRFIFYYDKPAMLLVAYMAAIAFFAVMYIIKYDNIEFARQYRSFMKITLTAFLIFYFLVLFYCFFLSRNQWSAKPHVNFVPFDFFRLMKEGNYEYEFYFLAFGNVAVFFPLGLLLAALFKGRFKALLVISPFIISGGVELCQYIFRYGWPDIDDVIFNVFGFYLGVLLKILLDKIIQKASKGKINSVFTF